MSETRTDANEVRQARKPILVLHPLFFAAFPVLSLFASKVREVETSHVWLPLMWSVAGAAALFGIAWLALHSWPKAGLAASVLVLLFFTYGQVLTALEDRHLFGVLLGGNAVLLPSWCALALGGIALVWRSRRTLHATTKVLNVVAVALVVSSVFTIGNDQLRNSFPVDKSARLGTAAQGRVGERARDIYYIILDRYAGQDTLKEEFNYDNSPFLDELERLGFFVATDSRAPYPNTTLSLASSLNMQYLDDLLSRRAGTTTGDWTPALRLLQDYEVARHLRERGYRYYHMGSWWEGTRTNPLADKIYSYDAGNEFSCVLLDRTIIGRLFGRGCSSNGSLRGASRWALVRQQQFRRVHHQWGVLNQSPTFPGPFYFFAHFTLPHDPYVFDRDGSFQNGRQQRMKTRKRAYLDQLEYTSRETLRLLRRLLARPESERPIIVLQSDEGPHPIVVVPEPEGWTWRTIGDSAIKTKFRILNAYYLPEVDAARDTPLTTHFSPVNTFRMLLNVYFGEKLPYLPEESYVFEDWNHLYKFVRVSAQVRAPGVRYGTPTATPSPLPTGLLST